MISAGPTHFGIDIGSTSIKGAILDLESGQVIDVRSKPFPSPIAGLPAGYVEVATKPIIETVEAMVDELTAELGSNCHGWICGQMGGLVLVDDRGNAKSNYLSWRDQRSVLTGKFNRSYLDRIRDDWPEPIMASLGRELQPGSTSTLLNWLSEMGQLADGVMPVSVADFVISHFAKQPGRMHTTHAIGLLDLAKNDWNYQAFEKIGIGDLWWPELNDDLNDVGEWARGHRTIHLHGSYGDQQCALYGADLQHRELSINISTGSQVSLRASQFQSGPYQTRKYFGNEWLNTVTHLPAGRSLNAMVSLLSELATSEGVKLEKAWETIASKMNEVSATDLRANLAFFAGPLGNSGALENLTTENMTVGHLFLSACQSMVQNYAFAAKRLSASKAWSSVVLSGGLSQSLPRLTSLIRDAFPVPLRESMGEETLTGLLKLAQSHTAVQSSP